MMKLISKFSIKIQLVLVVSCFLVPIALLAWLFIAQSNKDIQFAVVEESGVSANDAIWPILNELALSVVADKSTDVPANKLAGVSDRLAVFGQSADLVHAQQKFAASLEATRKPADADPVASAVDLMTQVGNASNLILDPDLDSFYTMDVSVVKLPSLLQNVATFLQSYRSAAADGSIDESEKIELSVLIGQVKSVVEGLDGSLQQAYSGNPDGLVAPALQPGAATFDASAKQFLALSNAAILAPASSAIRSNLEASAKSLFADGNALWIASDAQLARLLAARKAHFIMTLWEALGASGLAVGLACLLSFTVIRSVTGSVKSLVAAVDDLSRGALTTAVPGAEAATEIGAVARAVGNLRDSIISRVNDANDLEMKRKEHERQHLERIVLGFRNEIIGVIASVNGSVGDMSDTSLRLSEAAQVTEREAQAATTATGQASVGIQTIAAATEELGASIEEIAGQAERAAEIVRQAASIADSTDHRMRHLSTTASEIGAVTDLISKIAEQTNLLALNATIEAARAGMAGRGFAVVATEVKSLAGQAAQASNEIAQRIAGVQLASADVAESIGAITATINNVKTLAASIASSVTEQNAATQEITQSVGRAAAGSSTAAHGVDEVVNSVGVTRAAAVQVDNATNQLKSSSQRLSQTIDDFLREIGGEIQDRRRSARFAADGEVVLLTGGNQRQGQLLDISEHGARIATPGGLVSGQQISLTLPTGRSLDAKVAWTTADEIGLKIEGAHATSADIAAVRRDRRLAS